MSTATHDPMSCNLDGSLINAKYYDSILVLHYAAAPKASGKRFQDMNSSWSSPFHSNPPNIAHDFKDLEKQNGSVRIDEEFSYRMLQGHINLVRKQDMNLWCSHPYSNPLIMKSAFKASNMYFNVLGRSTRGIENRNQLLEDDKYHEVHTSDCNRKCRKPIRSDGGLSLRKNNHVMLLIATLYAILTFSVGLHPPNIISTRSESKEDYLSLTRSFILFNSVGFFVSMAMIMLLLQKYPLKPWPTFCVLSLLVCYVFSTVAIFPNQSLDLLLLASSFALFATAWMFKMGFCER